LVSAIEKSETTGVLVDGFPRNIDNFNAWFDAVKGHQIDSNSAIHFKCSEQAMLERIQKRGRADDNAEAFASRVKVYLNDSIPLLDKYKTVLEVNAA
jgi:adenylate kinase family enzyme